MEQYAVFIEDKHSGDMEMIYIEGNSLKHHDENEIAIDDVLIEFAPKINITRIKKLDIKERGQ